MIKSLLLIIILLNTSYSITNNIKELQIQFKQDVIELNVFKKRYGSYLEKKCEDNLKCFKTTITRLKSWDTVKKDNKLRATVGNGKYDIEIKTISGDINVN